MSRHFTCAIAGLGRIGSTLEKDPLREKPSSHAGAIDFNPRTILVAGADPDEDRRREFRADWNGVPAFEDACAMVDELNPDILHIASWTETHPEILRMALEKEVPVIVCEKPLADDIEAITDMPDLARKSPSRIIMNHERRFSVDYRKVREVVRDESLGHLHNISTRLYMGRKRPVKEIIYHDGTHMLDILRFLTDQELKIEHVLGDPYAEGAGLTILAHAGDCLVNMEMAGERDHLVFEFDLSFSSGRVRIGNGIYEVWESQESPYYSGFRSLQRTQNSWEGPTGYFAGMMEHAVRLAESPGAENESTLDDGYAVLEIIRDILDSVNNNPQRG